MKTLNVRGKLGEIEIALPIFRKTTTVYGKVTKYMAILENEQVLTIVKMDDFVSVVHCDVKTTPEDIASVFSTWEVLDESDFVAIHEGFLRKLSLAPVGAKDANDLKHVNI